MGDGPCGRCSRAAARIRATRQAGAVGKGFAVLLGLAGLLLFDPILVAIALFYNAAASETRRMLLDAAFENAPVEAVMTPADELETVTTDTTVGYPVLRDGRFVGIVTLEDVQSTDHTDRVVETVMTPREQLATVQRSAEVMEAFELLGANDTGRLPVVNGDGSLAGMVTRTDLMRLFRLLTGRHSDGALPTESPGEDTTRHTPRTDSRGDDSRPGD